MQCGASYLFLRTIGRIPATSPVVQRRPSAASYSTWNDCSATGTVVDTAKTLVPLAESKAPTENLNCALTLDTLPKVPPDSSVVEKTPAAKSLLTATDE